MLVRVLVAYDVADDMRRRALFNLLRRYAVNTQYSVFEANLTEKELVELEAGIRQIVDVGEDKVLILRLCGGCLARAVRIGVGEALGLESTIVI